MVDWDKLVEERNAWIAHNFPNETEGTPGLSSIYGVIEELGELAHAHLKQDQQIRGDATKHEADARDAIGDLSVYLMGVMSLYGVRPPGERNTDDAQFIPLLRIGAAVGHLADEFMVGEKQWMTVNVDSIVDACRSYCEMREWDYDAIVLETWTGVRRRDWIKFPGDGLTH